VEEQKHSWEGRGAITTTPGTLTKRETFYYNLSLPISTAIIGCDSVEQVEECVELARSFTPLSQAQMAAMEAKVDLLPSSPYFSDSCPAENSSARQSHSTMLRIAFHFSKTFGTLTDLLQLLSAPSVVANSESGSGLSRATC